MKNGIFPCVAVGTISRRSSLVVACAALLAAQSAGVFAQTKGAVHAAPAVASTRLYHGEWFDVRYPAQFTVAPPSRKTLSGTGSDEATFTSPDRRVSCDVFSPQWNGKPSFGTLAPHEKEVSRRVQTSKDAARVYTTNATGVTVEAKNKAYTQRWEDG